MNRATRTVNVAILILLVTTTVSGVLAFAVGSPGPARWITGVHGVSGSGLLLLLPAKSRIARRGLRRPGKSRKVIGLTLAALVGVAVGSGLLHALWGWRPLVPGVLPMQLHVGAAVAAVLLLAAHLVVHRRRASVRRTDLDRRRALLGTGLVAGSVLLWTVTPGRPRRATGSHEIADVAAMPVTQWLFDPVPRPAPAGVRTPAGVVDLAGLPQRTVRAVLDCTGGWYSEQEWRGVAVADLGLPRGASVEVVSATGYRRRFPAAEAGSLLLATHLAGRPLSAGHGAPVRLVAPGRRGFWWVKWVVTVQVVDEPWWWQPPFPLQ